MNLKPFFLVINLSVAPLLAKQNLCDNIILNMNDLDIGYSYLDSQRSANKQALTQIINRTLEFSTFLHKDITVCHLGHFEVIKPLSIPELFQQPSTAPSVAFHLREALGLNTKASIIERITSGYTNREKIYGSDYVLGHDIPLKERYESHCNCQ